MDILELFHALPYGARIAAGSVRAAQLRWWRYGHETENMVEAALAHEHLSLHELDRAQQERLQVVLRHAAQHVEHYRDAWRGTVSVPGRLDQWPVLEKETLRAQPRRLVADTAPRLLFEDHTSGSSGTPTRTFLRRATVQAWYALAEARGRRWYGVSRNDRWGMLGGQLITSPDARRPPYWLWNPVLHQLYASVYHLRPGTARDYARALERHRVTYLLGYPSALHDLSRLCLEGGITLPQQRVVITNAEPLLPHQRASISKAFGCPVRETYGMSEAVIGASECDHGRLHLWPEAGVVEVVDAAGRPVMDGEIGEALVTGLLNLDMPLVRYRSGDRLALAPPGEQCGCGRTLPVLAAVDGRADDVVVTADGRRIGRLDPVFKADLPIHEAQIVQEDLDHITVRVVPTPEFTAAAAATITERLRQRVGPMTIRIQEVERLERSASGKLRAVVSHVDVDGAPTDR